MTIFHHFAPRALSIFLGLTSMLLPLKPANIYAAEPSSPPECQEGYEYVESVGKCYKKCNTGWERNPETNRCRKIRTRENSPVEENHSVSPTTCKEGYEYVESIGKCYKACAEGQERNPETNRCRKIQVDDTSGGSSASAPPSSNPSNSGSSTSGSSSSPSSSRPWGSSISSTSTCQEGYEYVESAGKCYKACTEGQERNPETNRCRKIQSDDSSSSTSGSTKSNSSNISSSATCKEGYEYVASAGKCYKACTDGQIRNPETNRCKKAESSTSTLKECMEGYERNPETNRCRKIKNNDGADYDVEVPATGGATSFIAVGAIIAIVLAGLVFIGFQYRKEIVAFLSKRLEKAKKSS